MGKSKSVGWGFGVILILILGLVVVMTPSSWRPEGKLSLQYSVEGSYRVSVLPFQAVDTSRPSQAHDNYGGADKRVLEGKIWIPKAEGKFPLLVYSHGFMSYHQEGAYMAQFLASHGYIVVAADFPLTNYFAPGGPFIGDIAHQPGDVSFLIDTLLERSNTPSDRLAGKIDASKIGAFGLSLGGMTTTLAAFDGRMKDERIRAAVSIAGPGHMFNQTFFAASDVPFMMIAGDQDAIVTYSDNALPIIDKDPDSILVTLHNGSHTGFAGISAYIFRWLNHPDWVGCSSVKNNLEKEDEAHFSSIVNAEFGVVENNRGEYCQGVDNLPRAMRPVKQHVLTTLAVFGFFESHFGDEDNKRKDAERFLLTQLAAENPKDVAVKTGAEYNPR